MELTNAEKNYLKELLYHERRANDETNENALHLNDVNSIGYCTVNDRLISSILKKLEK